ncbi:hypothetical protein CUMW_206130 [Citrus unshiu]|uniref:Uncharacterized protein n=1 Tax=Citrus unshiu TaxID=55188 RepID=A0A2H5Q8U0_CITUN|nr:hypothetical protein CUMW_206130 [Citrus unshiu]
MIECSVCHSTLELETVGGKTVSRAYDRHRHQVSSKTRFLNVALVVGDCILVGLQPILVYTTKVDGGFKFSPVSVNFLTEAVKVFLAIVMLLLQARHKKVGEKSLLSFSTIAQTANCVPCAYWPTFLLYMPRTANLYRMVLFYLQMPVISFILLQAARNNVLLAVPAFLYAINNYLKFIMQLYFNPATVKMLSNLKVFVIALLLKIIMKRRFSIIQWEALALLLIGISVNQLRSLPEGTSALGLPVATGAYLYTLIFVTVPSLASVFNEYALKSQYDTSIYHQNLFLYGYGAIFNFLGIVITAMFKGPSSFDILQGHSKATMLLICNNAAQGILSSFFFKYADTILKKYSSTVATIFTGLASAALFGHTLTMNFILGISIVFISMHQFFSPLSKVKDEPKNISLELVDSPKNKRSKDTSFIDMAAGANEDASHRAVNEEKAPLLPI